MSFLAKNFLVPITFFLLFHWIGPKVAIGVAVVMTAIQIIWDRARGEKLSPFFAVASFFTVAFGLVDLFLRSPRFFKLEPFFQNSLMGLIFAASLITDRPLIVWFAEAMPMRWRPHLGSAGVSYLRGVTLVWSLYFFLKAALFLWLAYRVDLGKLVILRSVVGGSTLVLMIVGEIGFRKWRNQGSRSDLSR